MERVRALINKLQEQIDQQADSKSLLVTVQLLQAELLQCAPTLSRNGSAKVAVVMPSPTQNQQINQAGAEAEQPVVPGVPPVSHEEPESHQLHAPADWLQNLMQEIPTLAHQKNARELNDVIAQPNGTSLNDKLKQNSVELSDVFTHEPVRDLKKAIGVNDRFVFVNELFRGDEVMYERSIKTINSFHILQEAEFWIERELKLKQAWDDSKDSVRHFLQLVRRRFS